MAQTLIFAAKRTPIGRFLGGLSGKSAVELGAIAAKSAIAKASLDPSAIDEAIVGNVVSAGLGQSPARQVAIASGIPAAASALTVNMVCGSGLRAVMLADALIRSGEANIVLAGGIESMSRAPHLLEGARAGWKYGTKPLLDSLEQDGLRCPFEKWPMGSAADYTAKTAAISRSAMDQFALESHRRAVEARNSGVFDAEIAPVEVRERSSSLTIVHDENPRAEASIESLSKLSPAFDPTGVSTAGNSSSLADGAAMLVCCSSDRAGEAKARPLARVVSTAISGGEPRDLFFAPVKAIAEVLAKARLKLAQVDLFEINEAFASQMLACLKGLELSTERVNIHGGAIALGHPIGASGARILVTLLHALEQRRGRYGVASACLGGGNAVAVLIERIDS